MYRIATSFYFCLSCLFWFCCQAQVQLAMNTDQTLRMQDLINRLKQIRVATKFGLCDLERIANSKFYFSNKKFTTIALLGTAQPQLVSNSYHFSSISTLCLFQLVLTCITKAPKRKQQVSAALTGVLRGWVGLKYFFHLKNNNEFAAGRLRCLGSF